MWQLLRWSVTHALWLCQRMCQRLCAHERSANNPCEGSGGRGCFFRSTQRTCRGMITFNERRYNGTTTACTKNAARKNTNCNRCEHVGNICMWWFRAVNMHNPVIPFCSPYMTPFTLFELISLHAQPFHLFTGLFVFLFFFGSLSGRSSIPITTTRMA